MASDDLDATVDAAFRNLDLSDLNELIQQTLSEAGAEGAAATTDDNNGGLEGGTSSGPCQLGEITQEWEVLAGQPDDSAGSVTAQTRNTGSPLLQRTVASTFNIHPMFNSVGQLSTKQKVGLLIPVLATGFGCWHHLRDRAIILPMAKKAPIAVVYLLTQRYVEKGDESLSLELAQIAITRTKGQTSCDAVLALSARGHACHRNGEEASYYQNAMGILAQVPETPVSFYILLETCSNESGIIDYLKGDNTRDIILEFEKRLSTFKTSICAFATPKKVCNAFLGLAMAARSNRHIQDALQIHGKASLRFKKHEKCCQNLRYWVSDHAYCLAKTDKRPEAENLVRTSTPDNTANPGHLGLLFEVVDSERFAAVSYSWLQGPEHRANFFCDLAAAFHEEGRPEKTIEALNLLNETGAVPSLSPSTTTSPACHPTTATNIQSIFKFFSSSENKYFFNEDLPASFLLWVQHFSHSSPPPTTTPLPPAQPPSTPTPITPIPGSSWSFLVDISHDLLQTTDTSAASAKIINDYKLFSDMPDFTAGGCGDFAQCAKLWSMLHRLEMPEAVQMVKELIQHQHGCCERCEEYTPENAGLTTQEEVNLEVPRADFRDGLASIAQGNKAEAIMKWKDSLNRLAMSGKTSKYTCEAFQLVLLTLRNMALSHGSVEHTSMGNNQDDGCDNEWVNVADGSVLNIRGWDVRGCSLPNCANRNEGMTKSLETEAIQELDIMERRGNDMGLWDALCTAPINI